MKKICIFCMLLLILATTYCGSLCLPIYANELELKSKSACLIDYTTGNIMYEKNATEHLPIASMVKMMTILLTIEKIEKGELKESTMVTTTQNASSMGGSQVFIDPFVEYKVVDLLKAVIVASANDASVALAEHISGSEENFVKQMNIKANELLMNDTNYVNSTGLPAPEQYSCAKDCGIILRTLSQKPLYSKFSNIWMDEFLHPSGRKTGIVNTNRLIKYYKGCKGGKTGSTNEAGCCLSAYADKNGFGLISVIIGAPNSQTRFNECVKLFNFGFDNFENHKILDKNVQLISLPVIKSNIKEIELYSKENFSLLLRKDDKRKINIDYKVPKNIKAPLKQNEKVGSVIVSCQGNIIKEIDLIIHKNLEKISLKDSLANVIEKW